MNSRILTLLASCVLLSTAVSARESGVCITRRLTFPSDGSPNVNGNCWYSSVSADGGFVAFQSTATNLVPEDTDDREDIYVVGVATLEIELISVSTAGELGNQKSEVPSISGDGRYVAFHSFAGNLVPGDTNGICDVFVRDRLAGTTERVSVSSTGAQGNGFSFKAAISADGRFVAFCSRAVNLVPGDLNDASDVFIHDRQTGTTQRVTEALGGGDADFGTGGLTYLWRRLSISADGRHVAFASVASNLVAGDTFGWDVFVRDVVAGTTTLVSVSSTGAHANSDSYTPTMSGDGRYVAFESYATNLAPGGDTNGKFDVFRHDLQTGETVRVNTTDTGGQSWEEADKAAISPCGRFVAFDTEATDLVAGDTNDKNDIYVKDLDTGAVWRASVNTDGSQFFKRTSLSSVSRHGRVIAFSKSKTSKSSGKNWDASNVITRICLPAPESYCTAKINSQGCTPAISSTGLPTATMDDDFRILAENIVSGQPGILFWSMAPADLPFYGGTLCTSAPHVRTPLQLSGGSGTPDCTGSFDFPFTQQYMATSGLAVGNTVYAQYFYRDQAHPDGTTVGLSDALRFEILP